MTVVVKLGGRVQAAAELGSAIRALHSGDHGLLCLVHGGGDEVTALQRELGREPVFVGGRRVTTEEDIDLIRMVLSGSANKRLVSMLSASGVAAVGISGEDGGLLPAEPIDPALLGRAGKPLAPDTRIITSLVERGFLPVISPVGIDAASGRSGALNINGDDAAAAIASSLGAELWMIADVAGVLDEASTVIPEIDPRQAENLVAAGVVSRGMQAKLEAGFAALNAGSPAVRIASLDAFTDDNAGTFLSLVPSMT